MVSVNLSTPRVRGTLTVDSSQPGLSTWAMEIEGMQPHLVGKRVRLSARAADSSLHVGNALCTIAAQRSEQDEGYTRFVGVGALVCA